MDEVTAILARDFGLRPQGKSAPMAASKTASAGGASLTSGSAMSSAASSSWSNLTSGAIPNSASDPFIGDYDFGMLSSRSQPDFDDIFGGPPVKSNPPSFGGSSPSYPPPVFDSLLGDFEDSSAKSSSMPADKKPVFSGSDFFDAVPGPGSNRSSFGYDDVFFSVPSESNHSSTPQYEDLLQDFGHPVQNSKSKNVERSSKEKAQSLSGMDDLIPGFGGSNSMTKGGPPRASPQKSSVASAKPATSVVEDPFALFEINETQTKQTPDLESFFSLGARASSVPKQRLKVDIMFDGEAQNKGGHDGMRTSSRSPSIIRKASSSTNFMNDFSSIWGDPPSSGEFQEIEGESDERRRARLERHHRTEGRMAKALAEKTERDMQIAQEQAERQNIAGAIDIDIKQWAAAKEGNIRAMLSSLQHILWPQCGWQSVPLTDLITSDAVKKVYRKANLCIHPDKVQQKSATVEQKYIAEKVFDLLKEAYKKFSSEELR